MGNGFHIPSKFTVGSIDYTVSMMEKINDNEDFGYWNCIGNIKIAKKICGQEVSESRQKQTFWHELTHAILHQMGRTDLNDDEAFVNTFSSFLSEAVNTMEIW